MSAGRAVEAIAGDRAATFDAFAARHLDESYRLAMLIVGDAAAAQDATHDAFLAAWRAWPTLRDPSRFDAWFGRILVNTCRNALRRSRRHVVRDVSADLQSLAAEGDIPAETADRDALRRGFARLSTDHRIVVVLRYYGDLTVTQIAERTATPAGTVKSRLHYALQQLGVEIAHDSREDPG